MAKKKRASSEKIQTRWSIDPRTHRKIAVYKSSYGLDSLEEAANILLDKATKEVVLPD